jgi:hypothetical protein
VWPEWLAVVRRSVPSASSAGLIVRRPVGGDGDDSYETVFGQLIAARPRLLRLDYLCRPARDVTGPWTGQVWRAGGAGPERAELGAPAGDGAGVERAELCAPAGGGAGREPDELDAAATGER